jgi:hypothetical protein
MAFPARSLLSMSVWVVNLIMSIGNPCRTRVSCPDTKRTEFVMYRAPLGVMHPAIPDGFTFCARSTFCVRSMVYLKRSVQVAVHKTNAHFVEVVGSLGRSLEAADREHIPFPMGTAAHQFVHVFRGVLNHWRLGTKLVLLSDGRVPPTGIFP